MAAGPRSLLAFWVGGACFFTSSLGNRGTWRSRTGYWLGGLAGYPGDFNATDSPSHGDKHFHIENATGWQGGADAAQKSC